MHYINDTKEWTFKNHGQRMTITLASKKKKQMLKNFSEQHKEVKRLEQNKTKVLPTNFQPICACVKE